MPNLDPRNPQPGLIPVVDPPGSTVDASGQPATGDVPTWQGDHYIPQAPGGGGAIQVTDGITTVNPASEIDFTSGATVTDGGGGIAQVAVSGGSQAIKNSASVHLTSAQIKALDTVPVELVPAVAGTLLAVMAVTAKYTPGMTAYALALNLTVGSATNGVNISPCGELEYALTTTDPYLTYDTANANYAAGGTPVATQFTNIEISANGAVTLGDGTLDLVVTYQEIPSP